MARVFFSHFRIDHTHYTAKRPARQVTRMLPVLPKLLPDVPKPDSNALYGNLRAYNIHTDPREPADVAGGVMTIAFTAAFAVPPLAAGFLRTFTENTI